MRSSWINDEIMEKILGAMMPANRLAIEVSIATGLRISDVLSLKTETVRSSARPYVRDQKTGKKHRVYLPVELRTRMLAQAGRLYIWEGRNDWKQHRSRQAVYKDMKEAVTVYRRNGTIDGTMNPSPHSARKIAAVRAYKKGGYDAAAALLNHDLENPLVTMIYALSNEPQLAKNQSSRARKRSVRQPKKQPTGHHQKQR